MQSGFVLDVKRVSHCNDLLRFVSLKILKWATDSDHFKIGQSCDPGARLSVSFGHYPRFHDMILDIQFTPGQRLEIPEDIITAWNNDGAFIIRYDDVDL